jgi:hypothetical protein
MCRAFEGLNINFSWLKKGADDVQHVKVQNNDDLFDRLENAHFFRLFTGEGDTEYTCYSHTEHRGLGAGALPLTAILPKFA